MGTLSARWFGCWTLPGLLLIVTMGPGDSKLLCGPATRIKGKERYDSKEREPGKNTAITSDLI